MVTLRTLPVLLLVLLQGSVARAGSEDAVPAIPTPEGAGEATPSPEGATPEIPSPEAAEEAKPSSQPKPALTDAVPSPESPPAPALPPPPPPPVLDTGPLADFKVTLTEELAAIARRTAEASQRLAKTVRDTKRKAPELAAQFKRVKTAKTLKDGALAERRLQERFPAAELIRDALEDSGSGPVEDAAPLGEVLEDLRQAFENRALLMKAMLAGKPHPLPLEAHNDLFGCPDSVGWDDSGLYRYVVGEEYSLARVQIEGPQDMRPADAGKRRSPAAKQIRQDRDVSDFGICRFEAREGGREPQRVTVAWRHYENAPWDLESFQRLCLEPPSALPETVRLAELIDQFPRDAGLKEVVSALLRYCWLRTHFTCQHVFRIRDTWALAYVTAGCEVRKVSAADVERDVESWFATDVEKEQHLLLADRIRVCQAARELGLQWEYEEPVLPAECKKPKAAKRK